MTEWDKPTERNFAMNNPIFSWFAVTVLISGSALLASAAEPPPLDVLPLVDPCLLHDSYCIGGF
jgi:hypothetical protein